METLALIISGYLLAGLWHALDVQISLLFLPNENKVNMVKFFFKNLIFWPYSLYLQRRKLTPDRRLSAAIYAAVALILLSLDAVAWIHGPEDFAAISGCIIFGVFGLAAAYLSLDNYKKTIIPIK